MKGSELIEEIARRHRKREKIAKVTDATIAEGLGITHARVSQLRKRSVTTKTVGNLIDRARRLGASNSLTNLISPIVEFFYLDPLESKSGASWKMFSSADPDRANRIHPYLTGLKEKLEKAHGIYIFYDSRGRAIYAGKAQRQSLWSEMNSAFNRERGEVQSIKRVTHPETRVRFRTADEQGRRIQREAVALHEIASYVSAYEVTEGLIGVMEAFLVRAFANDLLNVRMERFPKT